MPVLKIACIGSAPSSVKLAPFSDPTWKIFGCSPGVMQYARRVHAWMEIHRWEPGIVGQPETQKQWFSPEYVAWMAKLPCVFMKRPVPEIPNSVALPEEALVNRYGNIWFTSSIAYMMALSIEDILERRRLRGTDANNPELAPLLEGEEDAIGLWGVDMAATEEYGYQRAGCQRFIEICATLGIRVILPPESDLMRPMSLYGIVESEAWHIKHVARFNELSQRRANAQAAVHQFQLEEAFVRGALDDHKYHMDTWGGEDRPLLGMDPEVLIESPILRQSFADHCEKTPIFTGQPDPVSPVESAALFDDMAAAGKLLDKKRIRTGESNRAKGSPRLAARIPRGKAARVTR